MSGIYIPDMNLPKDCPMCPMSHWNAGGSFSGCKIVAGKEYAMDDEDYRNSNERPDWCPIIELPPHGRLIDADAFLARNDYFADRDFVNPKYDDTLRDLVDAAE